MHENCTHTHTHTRSRARAHARTHTRTHARTHAQPHTYTHTHTHTHTHYVRAHIHLAIHAHTHARAHTHMHACTHHTQTGFSFLFRHFIGSANLANWYNVHTCILYNRCNQQLHRQKTTGNETQIKFKKIPTVHFHYNNPIVENHTLFRVKPLYTYQKTNENNNNNFFL